MSQDNKADPVTVATDKRSLGRQYLVDAIGAIRTLHSGASAPTVTSAYQFWADTTTGFLKMRNAADDGWNIVGTLEAGGLGFGHKRVTNADDPVTVEWGHHYLVDTSSGNVTLNLPADGTDPGARVRITEVEGTNVTTIARADGADTIDGSAADLTPATWELVEIEDTASDGYMRNI